MDDQDYIEIGDYPDDETDSYQEMREDEKFMGEVYPENLTELNKWIVDPVVREKFKQLSKDLVISMLNQEEIDRLESKLDLAYQAQIMGFEKASDFFVFKSVSKSTVNRSYKGFERKQLTTARLEKTTEKKEHKKRGWFKL